MDEGEERARDWLRAWQGLETPATGAASAAGAAHLQVHALDRAAARLRLDDEPWRLRTVLARGARR